MNVRSAINHIFIQIYESETASLPFLVCDNDTIKIGIFCYDAYDCDGHLVVMRYSSYLVADNNGVHRTSFQNFNDVECGFKISKYPILTKDKFLHLYAEYCDALQLAVDNLENHEEIMNADDIRSLFNKLVSTGSHELYSKICPEYIDFINGGKL